MEPPEILRRAAEIAKALKARDIPADLETLPGLLLLAAMGAFEAGWSEAQFAAVAAELFESIERTADRRSRIADA